MILIIGLGNPGKKYEQTRHNLGKMVVKNFAKTFDFPKFKLNKKLKAETTKNNIDSQEIILALSTTYMNESGQAAKLLASRIPEEEPRRKTSPLQANQNQTSSLWVVHDDIDLPLGKIRISENRSAAGHKGVQSIINNLGRQNFIRFRIGIKPRAYADKTAGLRGLTQIETQKFVLQKFNKNEKKIVKDVIQLTAKALKSAIKNGIRKAMNKYN